MTGNEYEIITRDRYDRDLGWKLNEANNLFDMRDAPFAEPLVPADKHESAAAARNAYKQCSISLFPRAALWSRAMVQAGMPIEKRKKKRNRKETRTSETAGPRTVRMPMKTMNDRGHSKNYLTSSALLVA